MGDMTIELRRIVAGKKHEDDEAKPVEVYTGTYEKYEEKPRDVGATTLVVKVDEKGRIAAVVFNDQILPYTVERCDADRASTFRTRYAQRLQGVILGIRGERPKR